MTITTVDEPGAVEVTATSPLIHLCPHRDEEDLGHITVTWRCNGQSFELHSLAEYLGMWEQTSISHEQLTDRIAHDLNLYAGIELVAVTTTWHTAGMEIRCFTSPTPADLTP